MTNKLLKLHCAAFAMLGAYLTAFGGEWMYTGREYGIALLALAAVAYCGGREDDA